MCVYIYIYIYITTISEKMVNITNKDGCALHTGKEMFSTSHLKSLFSKLLHIVYVRDTYLT